MPSLANCKHALALFLLLSVGALSFAKALYPLPNAAKRRQFQQLTHQFRCLVCQNEDLASSNAPLAVDLKRHIYERVARGASSEEIVRYMRARYGDFVLFKPPLSKQTSLLWFAPVLWLFIGAFVIFRVIQRARTQRG